MEERETSRIEVLLGFDDGTMERPILSSLRLFLFGTQERIKTPETLGKVSCLGTLRMQLPPAVHKQQNKRSAVGPTDHYDSHGQSVCSLVIGITYVTDRYSVRPNDTDSLIRPLQRAFYPTRIPPQHHQLKNFISTADPDIIYYASEKEVYALHKSNGKRELIASLPWYPQCLDAAHGWVCVGGPDNGLCASIRLRAPPEDEASSGTGSRSHAEVDATLPLDLDPGSASRLLDRHSYYEHQGPTRATSLRKAQVQYHELGTSIVNSVAIYRLRSNQPEYLDQDVALLT